MEGAQPTNQPTNHSDQASKQPAKYLKVLYYFVFFEVDKIHSIVYFYIIIIIIIRFCAMMVVVVLVALEIVTRIGLGRVGFDSEWYKRHDVFF